MRNKNSLEKNISQKSQPRISIRGAGSLASGGIVTLIIGMFIALVVAASLVAPAVNITQGLTTGASPALTGSAATIVDQIPLFLGLALLLITVGAVLAVFSRNN